MEGMSSSRISTLSYRTTRRSRGALTIVEQTIGPTVGNVLLEMMDLDIFNSDTFMIGPFSPIMEPVGKVKTGRDRFDLA